VHRAAARITIKSTTTWSPQALYPAYIDRYFCTPPPRPPSSAAPTPTPKPPSPPPLPSWAQLEAACAADPLFQRFVSPSMHIRAFSPTAILFNVDCSGQAGRHAILDTIQQGAAIWGAWLLADLAAGSQALQDAEAARCKATGAAASAPLDSSPKAETAVAAAAAAASGWLLAGAPHQARGLGATLLAEAPALDAAWRRFSRREPSAGAMQAAFGEEAIEAWWASMDGSARVV